MGEPVARIQDIKTLGNHSTAPYNPITGQFYQLAPASAFESWEKDWKTHIAAAIVMRRTRGAPVKIAVAKVNMPLEVGDLVVTGPDTLLLIEFLIGGRVSVNRDTRITIVNERAVADEGGLTMQRWLHKNGALWFKHNRLKEPLEIQTNGGTMGIRG